jgi:hypothetical protein
MLSFWYAFLDAPDDADTTVAMKAERTAIALTQPNASPWSSANKPCTPGVVPRTSTPTS